jgi:hypothetical protein
MHDMAFSSGTKGSVLSSAGVMIFIGHTIEHIPQRVQSAWSAKMVVMFSFVLYGSLCPALS